MESGYCYHITCRANNQEYLLEKYDYKARYQYYLTKAQSKFDTELWSYCLMDNHVHMLMKMYADSISKTMQWLNQNFASSVNLMQGRNGHFFGDRYYSYPVVGDYAIQQVIKYIHRNPIAANITNSLNYPWSSHNVYIGNPEKSWFSAEKGLMAFADGKSDPKTNYLKFVSAPDDLERLASQNLLSEKVRHRFETTQIPGMHEYVLSLPEHEASAYKKGQLDLLFSRLCLISQLDPYKILRKVQSGSANRSDTQRFYIAALTLMALSRELTATTQEEVESYLELPQNFLKQNNGKEDIKVKIEVSGLADIYRQTFPQRV